MELSKIYGANAKASTNNIRFSNAASVATTVVGGWYMADTYLPGMSDIPRAVTALCIGLYIQAGIMANVNGLFRHVVHGEFKNRDQWWMFTQTLVLMLMFLSAAFVVSNEGRKAAINEVFTISVAPVQYDSIVRVKAAEIAAATRQYGIDTARVNAVFADGDVNTDATKAEIKNDMRRWYRLRSKDPEAWKNWARKSHEDAKLLLRNLDVNSSMGKTQRKARRRDELWAALQTLKNRTKEASNTYAASKAEMDAIAEAMADTDDERKDAWSLAYYILVVITTFGILGFVWNRETYFKVSGIVIEGEIYRPTHGRKKLYGEIVGWITDWFKHAAKNVGKARKEANSKRGDVSWSMPGLRKFVSFVFLSFWCSAVVYLMARSLPWRMDNWGVAAMWFVWGSVGVVTVFILNSFLWKWLNELDDETNTPSPPAKKKPSHEEEWRRRDGGKSSPSTSRIGTESAPPPPSMPSDRGEERRGVGTGRRHGGSVGAESVGEKRRPTQAAGFTNDKKQMQGRLRGWKATYKNTTDPAKKEELRKRIEAAEVHIDSL